MHVHALSLSRSLHAYVCSSTHAFSVFRTVLSPRFLSLSFRFFFFFFFPVLFPPSTSPSSFLSFFFDVSRSVHGGVDTCARLLRDLHRRMCWDNLVVIVLSLLVSSPSTRPSASSSFQKASLFSLASIRGGSRMDGRKEGRKEGRFHRETASVVDEIFSFRKKKAGVPFVAGPAFA